MAAVEPDATIEDALPGDHHGADGADGAGGTIGGDGPRGLEGPGSPGRRRGRWFRRADGHLPAWLEIIAYVAATLLLSLFVKTFLVGMYSIPSESMEPYTYKGDRVVVDKLSMWVGGAPTRGDVIVFHDPGHWLDGAETGSGGNALTGALSTLGILPEQHDDLLIKRIIGIGGDTVECRTKDGPVYLNGRPLDESKYIQSGKNGVPCANGVYKVVVPKDSLWVLGDNRQHSADSSYNYVTRGLDTGFVPRSNVVGHVIGVVSWLRADRVPATPPVPRVPAEPAVPTGPDITVGQG